MRALSADWLSRASCDLRNLCREENLRRLVIRKETGSVLKQRAAMDGMETLRQDGWRRVLLGQTTVEEVVRVTQQDEAMAETDS
jgi:hypothetical protein